MFNEVAPRISVPPSCAEHVLALCTRCNLSFRLHELAYAALAPEPFHRCPRCRADLTAAIQRHVSSCRAAVA